MAKCKWCGRPIVWVNTKNGRAMMCDDVKQTVVTDDGEVVSGRVPHWVTCPAADKFKRGYETKHIR